MSVAMLTNEVGATRAIGSAFARRPQLAVAWLQFLGLTSSAVSQVRAKVSRDGRRADLRFENTVGEAVFKSVFVEAKLDAPVDELQLSDALAASDCVISLVPASIRPPRVPGVTEATWEDVLAILRSDPGADAVSNFIADEIGKLLSSPVIAHRRWLAQLAPTPSPPGWSSAVYGAGSGRDVLVLASPPTAAGQHVQIEIQDNVRGQEQPLTATVMACSTTSENDPVIWEALKDTARRTLPPLPAGVIAKAGATSSKDDRLKTARSHDVPAAWTYGYGRKHLVDDGWAGFGFRLQLDGGSDSDLVRQASVIGNVLWTALMARTACSALVVPSSNAPAPSTIGTP